MVLYILWSAYNPCATSNKVPADWGHCSQRHQRVGVKLDSLCMLPSPKLRLPRSKHNWVAWSAVETLLGTPALAIQDCCFTTETVSEILHLIEYILVWGSSAIMGDGMLGLGYKGKYSSVLAQWLCKWVLVCTLVGALLSKLCGKISPSPAKIIKKNLLFICLELRFCVWSESLGLHNYSATTSAALCLLPALIKSTLLISPLQTHSDASWMLYEPG